MVRKVTVAVLSVTCITVCILAFVNRVDGKPQLTSTTESPSTWEKIKTGLEKSYHVIYDETHCGFHKIKELVKAHEHEVGNDPCKNKPYQQSTLKPAGITLEETTKTIL